MGPNVFVPYAVFCEGFRQDGDGTVTIERLFSRISCRRRPDTAGAGAGLAPPISLPYAVCFNSAEPAPGVQLELRCTRPSGARFVAGSKLIDLAGDFRGTYLTGDIELTLDEDGWHVFDVVVNGTPEAHMVVHVLLEGRHTAPDATGEPLREPNETPKSGSSHPRCYARSLGDCSRQISKEHYVTHSILRVLMAGPGPRISGAKGKEPGETVSAASVSFARKMLCSRHNSGLSELDDAGKRLFDTLTRVNEAFGDDGPLSDETFEHSGIDIERWMLKILCGFLYSGAATGPAGSFEGWVPPPAWLRILYERASYPDGWGLYLLSRPVAYAGERRIGLAPVSSQGDPYGLMVDINGFPFHLSMAGPPKERIGTFLEGAIYRPRQLRIGDGRIEKVIDLGWDTGAVVTMRYTRTPPP
jgi:hypothetical protein